MTTTDHVLVRASVNSLGLAAAGFGINLVMSHTSTFSELVRYYSDISSVAADHGADDPVTLAVTQMLSQNPRPPKVAVGRMTGSVLQRYAIGLAGAPVVGKPYVLDIVGEGIAPVTVSYTPLVDLSFAPAGIDTTANTATINGHGAATGAGPMRVVPVGGTLPAPLSIDTNLWLIVVDANTVKFASTRANALAGTAIDLTSVGGGVFTLERSTNDVIVANLVQGLADAVGSKFAVAQVALAGDTDTLTLTAASSGNWCSVAVRDRSALTIAMTHAAPSDVLIASDLAALATADQGWYGVTSIYNSSAYVQAVAAWVEANGRIYHPVVCDSVCATAPLAGATDVGATVSALGYKRTLGPSFLSRPSQFLDAALFGRWLSTDPGQAVTAYKQLSGVAPDALTTQEQANLRARRMSFYYSPVNGASFFWDGSVGSQVNKFIDVTRNIDWLSDLAVKAMLGVFVGVDVVPDDPAGLLLLEGALRGVAKRAENARVIATGWVVTALSIDDVPPADRASRNYPGLRLQARFVGAIQSVIPVDLVFTF